MKNIMFQGPVDRTGDLRELLIRVLDTLSPFACFFHSSKWCVRLLKHRVCSVFIIYKVTEHSTLSLYIKKSLSKKSEAVSLVYFKENVTFALFGTFTIIYSIVGLSILYVLIIK